MTDSDRPPSPDRLPDLLDEDALGETAAWFDELAEADTDARKQALRTTRNRAEEQPAQFDGLADSLTPFLTDDDRAVRLTAAKLFVTLARAAPSVVRPVVDAVAARLADDREFYYVRARCAEALGYVALEHPEEVSDPETLAELRIGLDFDEPEVKEKLAKALEFVALGDPDRLRHQVSSLAGHTDDENDLVRYHLTTALVAIGCEHPSQLAEARGVLRDRLNDANPYVRGRATEALGLLARADADTSVDPDTISPGEDGAAEFVASRVSLLRTGQGGPGATGVGTLASLRDGTEAVVETMTTPDAEECPQCGLELGDGGPPMCPRCGTPH